MRLLASLAIIASVNAFTNEGDILKRTRRDDDDECEDGELINGICVDDELAQQINFEQAELLQPEEQDFSTFIQARRFPMRPPTTESDAEEDLERSKKRSQRLMLIMAQCTSNGGCNDENGKKLTPRKFFARTQDYGCHCWIKGSLEGMGGSGVPVDDIDKSCKELSRCHTCISLANYADEDKACDPVNTKYKAKVSKKNGNIDIKCLNTLNKKKSNHGDCKRDLCECDKLFAQQFANHFSSWNSPFWKMDKAGACVKPGSANRSFGNKGPPDQCCGPEFPYMKPYNTADHQCVDNIVIGLNQI